MDHPHIAGADGMAQASIWKNDEKLKDLSRIERNLISAFPLVVGLILFGMALLSPTPEIWRASACASIMLIVAPLLYILRVSIKLIIHLTLGVSCVCAVYIASQTGGVLSLQLAWLLFAPMMPLQLISLRAGVAWTGICLLIYMGMGLLNASDWNPVMPEMTNDFMHWSVLQRFLLCAGMLMLPWFYAKSYQHSITVLRQHSKVIRQKKAELMRAQQNKKKFISRLSHEMRTPMNAVIGYSHLMRMDADKDPEAGEVIEQIENSAQHLLGIINGIMDYTQLIDGTLILKYERVRLESLVQAIFNMFEPRAKDMRIAFHCQIDPSVPAWIEVDEARTRQVLLNLLEHALQRTVTGQIQLRINHAGPQLIFEVQDTGPTLSDDVAKHLVEGGSLNQHENLSTLGRANLILFMANSLTQLMGGRLQVKPTEPFGACIVMFLPQPPLKTLVEPVKLPTIGKSLHQIIKELPAAMLVVDDNPVNLLLVEQVIRTHWPMAQVVQASDGSEALRALGQQLFDIVLMDMLMPEMDGIEATRLLRQTVASENRAIPVLGLTANISTEDHQRCFQAGMNDIVLKPFDSHKLTQHIAHLLLESSDFRRKYAQQIQAVA